MAITVPGSGTAQGGGSVGTSHSISRPGGAASGDIMLLGVYIEDTAATVSVSGWNLIGSIAQDSAGAIAGGTTHKLWAFWRRDDTTGSPWTVSSTNSAYMSSAISTYRGCIASGSPVDTFNSTKETSQTASLTGPSLTLAGAGEETVVMVSKFAGSGVSTPPTGHTSRVSTADGALTAMDRLQSGSGATGALNTTLSGADWSTTFALALKPPASATTVAVNQATESDAAQSISPLGASPVIRMNNAIAANRERAQTTVHTFQRKAGKQGSFAYHNGLVFDFLAQEALAGGGVIMTQDWGVIRALRMSDAYTEL